MSAWGPGNLDNDTAADFQIDLEEPNGPQLIFAQLEAVAEAQPPTYLDADMCSSALAAAEYVAVGIGEPHPDFERPLDRGTGLPWEWTPSAADVDLCEAAIRRIAQDSELLELWSDSEHYPKWVAALDDVLSRLGRPPIAPNEA